MMLLLIRDDKVFFLVGNYYKIGSYLCRGLNLFSYSLYRGLNLFGYGFGVGKNGKGSSELLVK